MSAQHTPGPWVAKYSVHFKRFQIVDVMGEVCASVSIYGANPDANARLVAAAPELFEALQLLLDARDEGDVASWSSVWDAAEAAIAKARGEA